MGVKLTQADIDRVHAALELHGERVLLDASGANETSLARAALGLSVRRGTVALILGGLAKLEAGSVAK
jgi:hypothetical protein